ncbi:hypothetical protein H5410_042446 [Solanum commersonii]|uniref:Uncharacterized protein n=1 Tax=Solanum commersonii TaxID=4109 RepID=A0A9J5XXM8_SOLCO|nr:hypothetical protein H5410_042446 [Solanum commersonii]
MCRVQSGIIKNRVPWKPETSYPSPHLPSQSLVTRLNRPRSMYIHSSRYHLCNPPKGIAASKISKQLIHMVPTLNARMNVFAVSMFFVKTPAARPYFVALALRITSS